MFRWLWIALIGTVTMSLAQPSAPPAPPEPPEDSEMYAQARPAAPRAPRAATPQPAPGVPPAPPAQPALAYIEQETLNPSAPEEFLYNAGARAIDRRDWDRALRAFDAVVAKKGSKTEGALYWKAYALSRAGRGQEALAALSDLYAKFPQGRWLDDAKALEIEVRRSLGKPVSPEEQQNEELKLIAIHGISQQDPARAVPLLEKVLTGKGSVAIKTQALFVLSQINHPRSREVLLEFAKGKGNPDLQVKAIEVLGFHSSMTPADLASIYHSATDAHVKRTLLNVLAMQKDVKPLVEIARAEKDPQLKRQAVQMLTRVNRKEAAEFLAELLEK